ncbi:hypothetical protein G5C51_14245 [Streptomyces sp. A7024]|uniref:Uncharacterized protein n=1 Tax=Streptomyces coryli TaxID=1128680 RepID=A0A6G4TZ72_9ACTN|nr:hypothetical protein [Streptomyces coryli]NGN65052.1 hypothetical protein [Streptomyces coryli]
MGYQQAPAPPGYVPQQGGGFPQQGGGFPPPPPPGGGRAPGRKARIWGVVLIVLGVFPILGALAVIAAAVNNAQRTETNPEFAAKAWHNLRSDKIFPAHLKDTSIIQANTGWTRQGILRKGFSCDENLGGPFKKQAESAGCKQVLAATYTDDTGKYAATVALVVTRSNKASQSLAAEFDEAVNARRTTDPVKPPIRPIAVPNTPAAQWRAFGGAVTAITTVDENAPYAVAVTAGHTDLKRKFGYLPGTWADQGPDEVRLFPKMADELASIFSRTFPRVMEGEETK